MGKVPKAFISVHEQKGGGGKWTRLFPHRPHSKVRHYRLIATTVHMYVQYCTVCVFRTKRLLFVCSNNGQSNTLLSCYTLLRLDAYLRYQLFYGHPCLHIQYGNISEPPHRKGALKKKGSRRQLSPNSDTISTLMQKLLLYAVQ